MRIPVVAFMCFLLWESIPATAQSFAPPPPGFVPDARSEGANNSIMPPSEINRSYGISPQSPPPDSDYWGLQNGRRTSSPYPPRSGDTVLGTEHDPFVKSLMPFPNVWFSAEALVWWTKSNPVPVPLVTDGTSLAAGSPVILGDQNISLGATGGGRFTLGFGFGGERIWAAEGSYFFLNNSGASQGVTSDGSTGSAPLSFPFYNPTTPGEDSTPIALPGTYAGTAVLSVHSELQGLDANILRNIGGDGHVRYDLLGGFRYVNLQEHLSFDTDSPNVAPNPPAFFQTFDSFSTQSNFYGGQFGGRATFDNGLWFCNATGKLAIGESYQTVSINGGTYTDYLGPFNSAQGGYLAQPSNIGTQTSTRLAFVPELNTNFGVYLTPWARLSIGYSFLYISSVARPGNQIDRVINPSQSSAITGNFPATLTGVAAPVAAVHSSSFWAQGLNLGLEFRY